MSSASSSVTSAPVRLTGRVKWFNNKTGFGFISVVGGNDQFKDASEIFVHHSAVTVSQEQYRYLVEGEYVEFSVVDTESGTHKFQAGDVRGVKGGKLFCETRREQRATQDGGAGGAAPRGGRVLRGRGGGAPRSGYDRNESGSGTGTGGSEWMLVRRGRPGDRPPYRPRQERSERPERNTVKQEHQQEASVSTPAPVATTPAPTTTDDVPSTPRTTAPKKPRQTKPTF